MRQLRAAWAAGVAVITCVGLVAAAQTVMPALHIELKDRLLHCNSVYERAPFDKPFEASCIVRGEADASGAIRATDASCDRADITTIAKACLENYRVTEAWRPKTTSVCTEISFSRPRRADSKYNDAIISGATTVSWVDKCPPPGATRDPLRATAIYVTDPLKGLPPGFPPGLLGKDVKVTPLSDLPPEVQKAIAEAQRPAANPNPMRITQDFRNPNFQDCFKPSKGKKEAFEQACRVTGEIDGRGRVRKTKASCADASLQKPAESCVGSYKLMDQYAGYEGPFCVNISFLAVPKTDASGRTVMSAVHDMTPCREPQ